MALLVGTQILEVISSYTPTVVWGLGTLWIAQKAIKTVGNVFGYISKRRMLAKWANSKKGVVIVHRFPAAKTCPNSSPFPIKLETYLRMAKIPYEVDENDFMGEKDKCPWITVDGVNIADSQLCIEYLAKKYGITLGNYTAEQRAVGTLARITMDEHFYWGIILWRYVYTKGKDVHQFFPWDGLFLKFMLMFMTPGLKAYSWAQGMGRHSEEDVIRMSCNALRAVSALLGDKPYLLGSKPCDDDAAVFGQLAQVVWCCPNSPFEKLVNDELKNLKDYCFRMKTTFWPDWDDCLHGSKSKKTN